MAVPGAPTSLSASAGNAQVTLNWTAPSSPGGSPITGYDVLRGSTPGGESSTPLATEVPGTTYTDTSATNGTTYYYEVEAVNPAGPSAASNEASANPQAPPPPPTLSPTSLSTSLSGAGESGTSISVPWNTAVSDQATLSGDNASRAGGTVTYDVYSMTFFRSPFFSGVSSGFGSLGWQLVTTGGSVAVTDGSVPASAAVTLGPGPYFWQASYSGDALNGASQSTQGAEEETVLSPPSCPAGFGWWSVLCFAARRRRRRLHAFRLPRATTSSGEDGGVFVFPTDQAGGLLRVAPGARYLGPRHRGHGAVAMTTGAISSSARTAGCSPSATLRIWVAARARGPRERHQGHRAHRRQPGLFPRRPGRRGVRLRRRSVSGIAARGAGSTSTTSSVSPPPPRTSGYWLVTADGTVYGFGNAGQLGSATGTPSPVSGIAATPDGGGLLDRDPERQRLHVRRRRFYGSLPGDGVTPSRPVIGLVPTASEQGYWLIGGDGGIFAFGDAPFVGSLPALGIDITDIVGAVPTTL